MGIVRLEEVLIEAQNNKYGVPCLEAASLEMLVGEIMAAEERRSPLILAFPPHLFSSIPIEIIFPLMARAAEQSSVPLVIQLDHGYEFEEIMMCLRLGASAVMFDGSELSYEENVKQTKEIVKIAHALNASVEAELGSVGGSLTSDNGKAGSFTDPDMVVDFVKKTGVDALAISFGNMHGKYLASPNLDLDRIKKIRRLVDTPLVMHGGSGLTNEQYKAVIESGVSNIHYYSYMSAGVFPNIRKLTGDANPLYHDIVKWTTEYFFEESKKLMDVFGSTGRAAQCSINSNSFYKRLIETGKSSGSSTENIDDLISQVVREVMKKLSK